jgi:hypothetical protein
VFTLGRDRYALPVERVREVIRHRVPAAGVINRAKAKAKPEPKAQPSRKRSEKATRSTGGADTGSPSSVTE